MNYIKIYNELINKRKLTPPENCYIEKHHIIPVCMNGTNDKDNLVPLTAREHYIAHALLVKIHRNDKRYYYKLLNAMLAMQNCWGRISAEGNLRKPNKTSRLYAKWRLDIINYIKNHKEQFYYTLNKVAIYNNALHEMRYIYPEKVKQFILDNPGWSEEKDNTWPVYQKTKNMFHIYNIETGEGRFINKDKDIPEGWVKGYAGSSALHIQQYNPSKGKIWITNLNTKQSMLWEKDKALPDDCVKGRIIQKLRKDKSDTTLRAPRTPPKRKYSRRPKLTESEKLKLHEEKMAAYRERERIRKAKHFAHQREKYLILLEDYKKSGFSGFLKKYPDYNKSRNNLCNQFRRYCKKEFEQYKINNQKHIDITQ